MSADRDDWMEAIDELRAKPAAATEMMVKAAGAEAGAVSECAHWKKLHAECCGTVEKERDEALAKLAAAEADRDGYRDANESVRVCSKHTDEVASVEPGCLVCEADAAVARAERAEAEADGLRQALGDAKTDYLETRAKFDRDGVALVKARARVARLEEALK